MCNKKTSSLLSSQRRNMPVGIPGFTMVEVMVSLCVLGFSMMAVFATLNACSIAAHHARMLTQAVLLAESRLVETRQTDIRAFAAQEGEKGRFSWQAQIVPTPLEGLGAIRVQVTWREQERPQHYELRSLVRMKTPQG